MALLDLQAMELAEEISGKPKGSRASKHCGGGGGGGNISTLSVLFCAK